MRCSKCNEKEHEPNARFCHVCGCQLGVELVKDPYRTNTIPEYIAPVTLGHRWCLIDSEGHIIRELPYCDLGDEVRAFHDGFACVRHQSKTGYIDKAGNVVVPIVYNAGSDFSEQRAAVFNGSFWGYLNNFGNVIVPFEYNHVRAFSEGLAAVEKNDKWGYIDGMGRTVIPFIFEDAHSFSQGLAPVRFEDGYGYINKNCRIVIPARNDGIGIRRFLQKHIRSISGRPTLLNATGELVTNLPFHNALPFSEGFAIVEVKEGNQQSWHESYRYRFIDQRGDFIQFGYCDNSFGMAGNFSEGIAAVSSGKHVSIYDFLQKRDDIGYIDIQGKSLHGFHLNTAYPFKEGMARIGFTEGGIKHTGFIDKSGTLVIDYTEDEFNVFYNFTCGLTPVGKRDGCGWRYGYINKRGDVVIPFKYDRAYEFG